MGSISGFNSSLTGGFSEGDPVSASKLNKLASGFELSKTQFSDGLLFQGGPSGIPYTTQYPTPLAIEGAPEQFQVKMDGDNLYVAKGRVICRTSPNGFTGGCLREYDVIQAGVWPLDSFVDGTDANSPWVDNGGYFTLTPPEGEELVQYGVYLILNQYQIAGGTLSPGVPYLAIMPLAGDAWTKTEPFGDESACDLQRWFNLFEYKSVTVEIPTDPYEVSGNFEESQQSKLQNYNCQRIPIALISWDSENSVWVTTQYAIGTLTIPYGAFYSGVFRWENTDGFTPPSWFSTPYYAGAQADWEGNFTDCAKWDGTGTQPTQNIPV